MSDLSFFVYSRGAIEAISPHDDPHVIVSITSSPDDRARLPEGPSTAGVLRLSFADRDAADPARPAERVFDAADARSIWNFLLPLRPRWTHLVVHCDAGQCRSPAVAAAVASALGADDEPFFRRYRPNMRVYRTLLDVYHDEFAPPDP